MGRLLTPSQIAERYQCSRDKVCDWIRRGEFRGAIDISAGRGAKPRYLVPESDLDEFERRRQVQAPPKRERRRREPESYVKVFPE